MTPRALLFVCATAAVAAVACRREGEVTVRGGDALAPTRILFGHQSVGDDIVQGLAEIGGFRIVDITTGGTAPSAGPWFAHARIGRNGDPRSKSDAFAALLDTPWGRQADVALHKYCYADIHADTDVAALFAEYRQTMGRLQQARPDVTFVHVTAPLVRVQAGPKAGIKKLLRRMPHHYADNFARERFNDALRREYGGRAPIFDLAALESSRPGAAAERIRFGPMSAGSLLPDYTSDGGHLNREGRLRMARALVVLLSGVAADRAVGARRAQ
jgi:hypothetical protein